MKKIVMSFIKTFLLIMLLALSFNLLSFHTRKYLFQLFNYSFDEEIPEAFGHSFPHFWHIYSIIFCGPTDCPEQNDYHVYSRLLPAKSILVEMSVHSAVRGTEGCFENGKSSFTKFP